VRRLYDGGRLLGTLDPLGLLGAVLCDGHPDRSAVVCTDEGAVNHTEHCAE